MKKYSPERRLEQLFKYFQAIMPANVVATSYDYVSYNHQSSAQNARDANAMDQAQEYFWEERRLGIERMGEDGYECLVCGFCGKNEEWHTDKTVKCPKCGAYYTYQFRYAIIYDDEETK